jgi:DNA-binding response OmpR family regulator
MIRILIVEDEAPISSMIALSLKKHGYACECVADGAEAADQIEDGRYDLILLDVMLPGLSGFELMELIRPLEIPVIFLTARNAVDDRVKGLRLGAEDYIVKPFAVTELLARVDVVLRRYKKGNELLCVGGVRIDTRSMQAWRGEQSLSLTRKEFDLLVLFARNPNAALYRETIYEQVWGGDLEFGSKAVDLAVQRLRKKVGWEDRLRAVSGVGYRLEVEP